MLEEISSSISLVILLIVNVKISVLWVPLGVAHGIFLCQVLLRAPQLRRAVGVLWGWELSLIFRDVHLIVCHQVMNTWVHFVFKPSVWNTQIVVGVDTDWQLSWNWVPGVLVHLPDWCVTEGHLCHLVICTGRPENFYLLSLRVSNNLTANVGLVSLIEDINT